MESFNLYKDIKARTNGEIYLGVVGPVRTGKSTFIKRFMDVLVLPAMEDEAAKTRAIDELPQSAGGKTVTTTEPKFIPKEAAQIQLGADVEAKVRLIDCVGYMVEGAAGHMENEQERMVKTPWFEQEIPFTQAAGVGTDKVITDHSTVGIVVTSDGSFGEITRRQYMPAEEKTIAALKKLHKPFIVLLNSAKPYSEETKALAAEMEETYRVKVIPVNCEQLKKEDIHFLMESILYEFPLSIMEFNIPKWVEMLPNNNHLKSDIIDKVRMLLNELNTIRDVSEKNFELNSEYVELCSLEHINLADGTISLRIDVKDSYYYEMLSDLVGEEIKSEYHMIKLLQDMSKMKQEYIKVQHAMESVRFKGYGVVTPEREEIRLESPEVIRHGNKFGVKIKADSPSIHMIRANIETEIAPIVGSEAQAEDLIRYIKEAETSDEGIWDTNIFGKTVEQLVYDGITGKINAIGEESQVKLQDTMQKIVNDSNGGLVCIII
ncbi:MAG: stage IV sporulation protein A [Lachnospiraceae bacterium]|nr:stage IV sporulation protein A [Lachnospiraceae bacterium]